MLHKRVGLIEEGNQICRRPCGAAQVGQGVPSRADQATQPKVALVLVRLLHPSDISLLTWLKIYSFLRRRFRAPRGCNNLVAGETSMTEHLEYRRCQKCGRIETVADSKAIVEGEHSDKCDNEIENWTRFTRPAEWKPTADAVPREVLIPTAAFADRISDYSIGFVRLDRKNGVEDAICAGSGTLVKLGKVQGILTAAHVLEALPAEGEIGLGQFFSEKVHYRRQTFRMENATDIRIGGRANSPNGPDLAFLRLSDHDVGWLSALQSFYNLAIHRDDDKKDPPAQHSELCVVGAIDERTKDLPPERENERRKGFEAIITDANLIGSKETGEASVDQVKPKRYPDFTLPGNFGGTSGGGLWRIYFNESEGKATFVTARLAGVPFYQSPPDKDRLRTLTCHSASGKGSSQLARLIVPSHAPRSMAREESRQSLVRCRSARRWLAERRNLRAFPAFAGPPTGSQAR